MADSTLVWAATRPSDGGVYYRAPLASTLPTDATTALDAAFVDHGWLGEDGIVNGIKRATTKHHAFGGDTIKTTQDNYEETIKLTLLESDPDVLETVFGEGNVTLDTSDGSRTIEIDHGSAPLPRCAHVVEVIDGSKVRRLVVQEGQVVSVDDVKFVHTDLVSYTIEIDCYKPVSGNAEAVKEYIFDSGHAAGS